MELHFSLEEIDLAARKFWEAEGTCGVFAFQGPLGAGKTTFIAALCRAIGIKDLPSSPTFSLINEYRFIDEEGKERQAWHMDLYRIRDEEEAVQAGVEDCLLHHSLCFVEWPEKIPDLLPEDTRLVRISIEKEGRRKLVTDYLKINSFA